VITGIPGKPPSDINITVTVIPLPKGVGPSADTGVLHVRRQQVEDSLDKVIEKALRKKPSKLVNTMATIRCHGRQSVQAVLCAVAPAPAGS
jgi:hypothetical protein